MLKPVEDGGKNYKLLSVDGVITPHLKSKVNEVFGDADTAAKVSRT